MKNNMYIYLILSVVFLSVEAWGQTGRSYSYTEDHSKVMIQHKAPSWKFPNNESGLVNANGWNGFTSEYTGQIQEAHVFVDTIYMHKGQKIELVLPDELEMLNAMDYSIASYQRWYNYRTDGLFRLDPIDLLIPVAPPKGATPKTYRLFNGYVGDPVKPKNSSNIFTHVEFYYPTDEQFNSAVNPDNEEYLVACDVSRYTDYGEAGTEKKDFLPTGSLIAYEPTLSHRIIFVIRSIDNEKNYHNHVFSAQKNGISTSDYLESYKISMPSIRIPNLTDELVALANNANSYVVPIKDADSEAYKEDQNISLTVTIPDETNQAGIFFGEAGSKSNTTKISGGTRIIQFKYPNTRSDGLQSVNTPKYVTSPTSVILITKTVNDFTYRIAKFKLTFDKTTVLLPETLVNMLDNGEVDEDSSWASFKSRTPQALHNNSDYKRLTYLDFDNNDVKDSFTENPLPSEESSYAFFRDAAWSLEKKFPQWGYYSITNKYMEVGKDYWNSQKPAVTQTASRNNINGEPSLFHMFIDASERTGRVARLSFNDQLCPGAELLVTAWVKCARLRLSENNAAMLFTIMGVTEDGSGSKTYTPIYRHQTGQIPTTYFEDELDKMSVPGMDASSPKNEWMQVYFTFINDANNNFESYALQVDNYSASTKGGDMYLDDVRIYMFPPRAGVEQKTYACDEGSDTQLRMRLGWDRLLSRIGVIEDETYESDPHVSFCIVDAEKFDKEWKSGNSEDVNKTLFENTSLPIDYPDENGNPSDKESKYLKYRFKSKFTDNQKYNDIGINCPIRDNGVKYLSYEEEEELLQERSLLADIYAKLKPFHKYYLVIETLHDSDSEGTEPTSDRFRDFYTNPEAVCVAKTEFQIEDQGFVRINGELLDPDRVYCVGELLNFGMELRADVDGTGVKPVTQDVYYDWFFGSMADFKKEVDDSRSLYTALAKFRSYAPDASEIDEWTEEVDQPDAELISKYVADGSLILRRTKLDLRLPEPENGKDAFNMVVFMSQTVLDKEDRKIIVCAKPVEVNLRVSGQTPVVHVGFDDLTTYPDDKKDYQPVVRIGKEIHLDHINSTHQLKVPLRDIDNVTAGKKLVSYEDETAYLYLVSSNDPAVTSVTRNEGFTDTSWPVAIVGSVNAVKDGADNYLKFYFDQTKTLAEGMPALTFREGFWYTLKYLFKEVDDPTAKVHTQKVIKATNPANNCGSSLVFDLKVAPANLTWTGDGSSNWNKDAQHWKRSPGGDKGLHKSLTEAADYDKGYWMDSDTTYGYVPMYFTNVIVQSDKKIQLYEAEVSSNGTDDHPVLDLINKQPAGMTGNATAYIEYDLMVKGKDDTPQSGTNQLDGDLTDVAFNCETYYTNTVAQIHFEPATEMLHAEYLTYNKAWVDYKLQSSRWYTLSSPLNAVVAGDWYTSNSGSQTTEYFKDINFDIAYNNRFQPLVYQRAWKKNATMIPIGKGSSGNKTVAVAGNWSGVYNDVAVLYTSGTGFSVKVLDLPSSAGSSALFRFPKADTQYNYYSSEGAIAGSAVTVRTDADKPYVGKLLSDGLTDKKPITVELGENTANSNYYLIGNPFMSHLDTKKFFEVNNNLQKKFWLVTDGNQTVAVGGKEDNDWITNQESTMTIAPLQSFFVEKAENTVSDLTFDASMQVLGEQGNSGLKSASAIPVLTLVVTSIDGYKSRAAIAYDVTSSDAYVADEDAELFLDSNLETLPTVYTVAGTMATSINRTSGLWNIPIGIYGSNDEMVTLSFMGLDRFSGATLYDAEKKTEKSLYNGYTFTLPANSYGRYFLRAGTPTADEKIETEAIHIYTVGKGQLIVTSTEKLESVDIHDFSGRLLQRFDQLSDYKLTTHLNKGIYIVKVVGKHRQQTSKVQIR